MSEKTYIGLLRGINVGGKVLKMADLKQAIGDLGFSDVKTYLQSGNLVFRAGEEGDGALASRISSAIADRCAMDVHVLIRNADEWDEVIGGNPFPDAAARPKTLHAFAFDSHPDRARLDALGAEDFGTEQWAIAGDTLYVRTPDGFGKSRLGNSIERRLAVPMTARNWNTVLALKQLAETL